LGLFCVLAALLATFLGMILPSSKVDDFSVKTSAAGALFTAMPDANATIMTPRSILVANTVDLLTRIVATGCHNGFRLSRENAEKLNAIAMCPIAIDHNWSGAPALRIAFFLVTAIRSLTPTSLVYLHFYPAAVFATPA
jgi:hypothetical protein